MKKIVKTGLSFGWGMSLQICLVSLFFYCLLFSSALQERLLVPVSRLENPLMLHDKTLSFFKGGELDLPLSEKEKSHMYDVREKVFFFETVAVCALVIFVVLSFLNYFLKSFTFHRAIRNSLIVFFVLGAGAAGGGYFVTKREAFLLFHKVLFPEGNYLFTKGSFITSLYPREYFFNFFFLLCGLVVGANVVLLLLFRLRKY